MKTTLQDELWQKIEAFVLDDPYSNFPFSKKLEKENNWSPGFAARAIEEYRKFIYLCCIAPTGASPSDAVDKVWHLHLTYTQNYWISFCKKLCTKTFTTIHQKVVLQKMISMLTGISKRCNCMKKYLKQHHL